MAVADAEAVATLHIEGINTGFISSLGHAFVTALYQRIAVDSHAFGLVAEVGGQVVGFVAFTTDVSALYKSVLHKGGLRFVGLLLGKLFLWQCCKRMMETLLYPRRQDIQNLPRAELLAIAVLENQRRQGLGQQLLRRGLDVCREHGLDSLKVCVGGQRRAAQTLYENLGFQHICDIEHHQRLSHVYVKELTK